MIQGYAELNPLLDHIRGRLTGGVTPHLASRPAVQQQLLMVSQMRICISGAQLLESFSRVQGENLMVPRKKSSIG